ncbi:Uncharacterised protein [Legionella steigerwaltii]|uniref:Uncharacterized protein n=1 Tax=Legionella steigerwaltii TaxID=460 RepID=A0A378LFN2_9GAMM|nr:hypothetical protein [Legionella steigerwaltii]KTD79468.1 hypothetical protein Lstg_0684 [Legionella steigerwaltii]STY24648.1 Uncharacterised protein [Legionella steigerwaltii]
MRLSTKAILGALGKPAASTKEFPIDPNELTTEYALAEAIDAQHVSLEDTDMVVILSGRSGFSGSYLEVAADKFVLCENEYDETDTVRRMEYGINIAKQCTQNNRNKGITKPVYVYFNGVQRQNEELRNILRTKGEFNGYPAELFIIDAIPFDNTLGQVLGLSRFLDTYWSHFCKTYNLTRSPNLVICTSSYHVPRVTLAHGANSPLLTAAFWLKQPELVKKLSHQMQKYVLNPGEILKKSTLIVLGCDRQITANPCWEKDLKGDMEARVRYSYLQKVPSIAQNRADNDVTVKNALVLKSFYNLFRAPSFFAVIQNPKSDREQINQAQQEKAIQINGSLTVS